MHEMGVVGIGLMGSGIAEVLARAGVDRVIIVDVSDDRLLDARARIERSLERAVRSGKISAADGRDAIDRMTFTTCLQDLADCQVVFEAIVEGETEKIELYRRLDEIVVSPDAILASNTSAIPIMKLSMATSRPANVIGVHFFNPVPVLELVELVPSLLTSAATIDAMEGFVQDCLGKYVIRSQDRAGFIVNALLVPYMLSAVRMFESGFAAAADIDAGMVKGCGHPMGPLALADFIGLDTTLAMATSLYEEFGEPLHAPPALLRRMVEAGLVGRKSGRGFYVYE